MSHDNIDIDEGKCWENEYFQHASLDYFCHWTPFHTVCKLEPSDLLQDTSQCKSRDPSGHKLTTKNLF